MKGIIAWLVRRDPEDELEIVFTDPSRRCSSYCEVQQIVYFEVEEK